MDNETKARLEEAGFYFGGIQEFLQLTDEELEQIEERIKNERLQDE